MQNQHSISARACKLELANPRLIAALDKRGSTLTRNIMSVAAHVEPILERIPTVFSNYTLHNIDHSIRIMEYMYDLIPDIDTMSELDIALMVYSALLHDIGMSATDEEIELIKSDKYPGVDFEFAAIRKKYGGDEQEALRYFVRTIHHKRASKFINERLLQFLTIPTMPTISFANDLIAICQGHGEDRTWLEKNLKPYNVKGPFKYSELFVAILLRLADILDIDSQRTPPMLYELLCLCGKSETEWRQHFVVENERKIHIDEKEARRVVLYGECTNAAIHRKLLEYFGYVNMEIGLANELASGLIPEYQLHLVYPLENRVQPKGYKISDLKLSLDFRAITDLLMGEKIYGERILGLRELVQNAIDTCRVRAEFESRKLNLGDEPYKPSVKVIIDPHDRRVTVKDNGMGMSMEILKKNFLSIGVSYYRSDDFLLKNYSYKPIGNFGIGFLACFMLSKWVKVKTRHVSSPIRFDLDLERDSEYICLSEDEDLSFVGSEITLDYNEVMSAVSYDATKIAGFLESNFLPDDLELQVIHATQPPVRISPRLFDNEKLPRWIDLEKYLIDSDGFIDLTPQKRFSTKGLGDIDMLGTPYFYDGESLTGIDESFDMINLYRDHCIRFIEIPIVSCNDLTEYDKFYEVLQNVEETIERMNASLNWISIFLSKDVEVTLKSGLIDPGYYQLLKGFGYRDLVNTFGQDENYPTWMYVRQLSLYRSEATRLYLPFAIDLRRDMYFLKRKSLFVRNVLVRHHEFRLSNIPTGLDIHQIVVNVKNSAIMTDISRNRLEKHSEEALNYCLSKTVVKWALDRLQLDVQEKTLLNDFSVAFFGKSSPLMI